MSPNLATISNGRKFMWDGLLYATRDEASHAKELYENDRFEVHLMEHEGNFLVYTRRTVKQETVTTQ
jgi:hypothetical protein